VGVSVVESLADALPQLGQRSLWVAIDSRRGRIFLHHEGSIVSVALDAIPTPLGPVAIAGDAAIALASRLAAKGYNVMLTDARLPQPRHIAAVAQKRAAGLLAPLALVPLYVDPPEARAMPLRPPPA
jgi:tRNA A37 threonylcarbamoyladenosine modification protein TsaB